MRRLETPDEYKAFIAETEGDDRKGVLAYKNKALKENRKL